MAEIEKENKFTIECGFDDYDDYGGHISVALNGQRFSATIDWCKCCGIKEVNSWHFALTDAETTKLILDKWIHTFKEAGDMPCAFLMFATVEESNHKLITEYLTNRRNTFRTPTWLNKNSNNHIQVFMVGV